MLVIKILSGLAFIGSIAWYVTTPSYEPAIAIATSLAALIGLWIADKKHKSHINQHQVVGQNSLGIQAGGNVSTGDIRTGGDVSDAE